MKGKMKTILISAGIPTVLILGIVVTLVALAFGQISKAGDSVIHVKAENYIVQNKTAKTGQTVLLGDSITEYFPVEEFFAEYTEKTGTVVYNRGISAEKSDHMSSRLESNALQLQPKNLVILIGTNDIGEKISDDEICNNIESVIERTQKACPDTNIVLQALYPINENMKEFYNRFSVGSRTNEKIRSFNMKLEQLAKEKQITYLDLTEKLIDKNNDFSLDFTYDGMHPSAPGYSVIAEALIPYLK